MNQNDLTQRKRFLRTAILLIAFAVLYFAGNAICYSGSTQAQFAQMNDGFWKTSWGFFALFLYGVSLLFALYCLWANKFLFVPDNRAKNEVTSFFWLAVGAFCIRVMLALLVKGYASDIACFTSWGWRVSQVGCSEFYAVDYFCDYPPGYIYILGLCQKLCDIWGIVHTSDIAVLIYKLPAMLCDIGIAYLFYHRVKAQYGHFNGMLAGCMVLFSPGIWVDSAMWGQVDSVWMLPMIACIFALEDENIMPACILYTISLLIKPQALMFGPVLLIYAIFYVVRHKGRGILRGAVSVGASCILFFAATFPFAKKLGYAVIWDKYFGTMTSYHYVTLNAPNLYYFFNYNVADLASELFGVSFEVWTTVGIVVSVALAAWVYWKNRDNEPLALSCTVLLYALFFVGPAMHERYLYPAALVASYLTWQRGDKAYNLIGCAASIVSFFSMACVLRVMHFTSGYPEGMIACALNLVTFGALVWRALQQYPVENVQFVPMPSAPRETLLQKLRLRATNSLQRNVEKTAFSWNKHDTLLVLLLTLIYAVVGLANLGDREWPETFWEPQTAGAYYIIDLGQETDIAHINILEGIGDGQLEFSCSSDGKFWQTLDISPWQTYYANFMSWERIDCECTARYVRIHVLQTGLRIHEIGLFTKDDVQLTIHGIQTEADETNAFSNAVDEQHLVPIVRTYENGTYFDEVYHARTALEQRNGWPIYEQTHPPLGKILISCGIQLFGLSPFGWRFMGAFAGVLMVPAMYVFGKLLFKKTKWAAMLAALMSLDFMHYTQTRIATIDSFSVLFIILMYLFMYIFLQQDFYEGRRGTAYTALGLSGIFFGIGAATKWICIYAGAGLALLFFGRLVKEFFIMRAAKCELAAHGDADARYLSRCSDIVSKFWKKTWCLIGFCMIFFVLIPCVIYVLSYIPYIGTQGQPDSLLQIVWQNQQYIFKYHSDYVLDQTQIHPYQSAWYTWPFIGRPIFYYMGTDLPDGLVSGISSFGNPAIWWFGIFAVGWVAMTLYLKKTHMAELGEEKNTNRRFIILAMLAQFVPWMFVTRSTYIYHYFATTPFLMMCIVYFFRDMEIMHEGKLAAKLAPIGYIALCLGLFVLFYPLITGVPVSKELAEFCRWLPGWVLYGYWL